ncbi:MAG: hybrid sensor histidine kinase/response regulator [Campylobacterota bacterium]|nr:hybrid sensor histidine kinase/response regulator [Campylobacterota bacterium]
MNSKNILIVDDTDTNIDILVDLLGHDYDLLVALDGETALSIVANESVDLILLDIMMPGLNGYDVCIKLKDNTKTRDIPVIFLTAMSDEESIEKAFDSGGVDYVTKPFRPKELYARVKTQLNINYLQKKDKEYKKQKAISELAHNIAHHWRQPLSAISTTASGISIKNMIDDLTDEELEQMCENIVKTTVSLSSTLENFDTLINITPSNEEINLLEFIQKNHDLIFQELIDQNSTILVNIDDDVSLSVNSHQLIQVLLSLVKNSNEAYISEDIKNRIFGIKSWKEKNKVIIQIYDNAGGIPVNIVDRIFEPYFTTYHQSEGKGLGLYNTQKIVSEVFLGYIWVSNLKFEHNKNLYNGASFTIEIPFRK